MHLITHLPLYFQLQTQMANCTRLHSTPKHFLPRNSITMFMTKSYLRFLKPSNVGDIILKALHSRSMWSPITRISNTFQQPKSSCVGKHDGPNTFPLSTSSFIFGLENSEPNPTHSLDDGTSILKRGIATMPVSIHRTTTRYSLPSNWHRPSELLPYQSQPFMDLSSWMLKGSILTFGLNSERIPLPKNTSITSQTPVGPSTQTVYFATLDASMSQTLAISDYVFFNIHMIIPLQVISVRRRHFIKSKCTITGLDFPFMSKTTANHVSPVPAPNPCAINLTDFSSNFRFPRNLGIPSPWIS